MVAHSTESALCSNKCSRVPRAQEGAAARGLELGVQLADGVVDGRVVVAEALVALGLWMNSSPIRSR